MGSWQLRLINQGLRYGVKPVLSQARIHPLVLHIGRNTIPTIASKILPVPRSVDIKLSRVDNVNVEWLTHRDAQDSRNVLLYIHGGAFVALSPMSHRNITSRLSRAAHCKVVAPNYRKAPEHPFPAALEDCMSMYRWLLENGYDAKNIMIAGDSAGGNLTLSTLLKIKEDGLPQPAAAMCISPWTDLTVSCLSTETNRKADPLLPIGRMRQVAAKVRGIHGEHPLMSPLYADLEGLPPLLVFVGSTEVIYDEVRLFAEKAERHDVRVYFRVWKNAPHVFPIFAPFMPEANKAIKLMCDYMATHLPVAESDNYDYAYTGS